MVVHATSSTAAGPYMQHGVVLAPRVGTGLWDSKDCHNPTVHKIGSEFVIFYIGVGVPLAASTAGRNSSGRRTKNSSGRRTKSGRGTHTQRGAPAQKKPLSDLPQSIGAAFSKSPNGPWTRLDQPLLTPTEEWECGGAVEPDCGVSNPAVVVRADASVLIFYRGNNDRGVGVASAKTWRGPYTKRNNRTSIFQGSAVVGLEDMYVFANPASIERPGCHMVLHQECAGVENLGAHAFTEDPTCTTAWQLATPRPSRAYGPEFQWDNGTTTTFSSRERPQMLLDAAGWPAYLSNGIVSTSWGGRTFTLVAPINTTRVAPARALN